MGFFFHQATSFDGNTSAKQPDGVVVSHALFDASRVRVPQRLPRVVFQSAHWNDRGTERIQRECTKEVAQSFETVLVETIEERG